jgi:integrase
MGAASPGSGSTGRSHDGAEVQAGRHPHPDSDRGGTARTRRVRTWAWNKATAAAGLSGFHFHDLRHTGNVLASEAGATLRELMDRMGHATTRAALIYQHRSTQRDKIIADEISKRAQAELTRSGTQRARSKKERS